MALQWRGLTLCYLPNKQIPDIQIVIDHGQARGVGSHLVVLPVAPPPPTCSDKWGGIRGEMHISWDFDGTLSDFSRLSPQLVS